MARGVPALTSSSSSSWLITRRGSGRPSPPGASAPTSPRSRRGGPAGALAKLHQVETRVPVVLVDRSLVRPSPGGRTPPFRRGRRVDAIDDLFVLLDETHLPSGMTRDTFVTGTGR